MVIRISKGSFSVARLDHVRAQLEASRETASSVRALHGCVHFWMAIDPASSTMVTVSVWDTARDANAMETLAPMLALTNELVARGVVFDKVVRDFETVGGVAEPTRDQLGDPHDPLICRSTD